MVEPVTTAAGGAAAPEPSLWAQAQALLKDLPGLIGDRIELLSLELRRAGSVLVKIVALVVMAAILGVTAWLALWVAVGGVLVALGLHYLLALLIVLLINLGAAWFAVGYARKLATRLALPATMRHLTPSPSTKPPPVPPSAAPVPPPVPPTPAVAATPTPAPAAPLQPSTSASRS